MKSNLTLESNTNEIVQKEAYKKEMLKHIEQGINSKDSKLVRVLKQLIQNDN